jgi:hypothetical protein
MREFQVECTCGGSVTVSEGMAGTLRRCACGREVAVPTLAELRRQAGLPAYEASPVMLIEHLLSTGELPIVGPCARCGHPDSEVLEAVVECERLRVRRWGKGEVDFKASAFTMLLGALVFRRRAEETTGQDLDVSTPLRVCAPCRKVLCWPSAATGFRILKFVLAAVALLALAGWPLLGAGLLGAALAAWVVERQARKAQQRALRQALGSVAVYGRLLEKYPTARIVWRDVRETAGQGG